MGWHDPDLYNQPEKFGLTVVGGIEWSEPCYSFDLTVVWVDEAKKLYWASDSGCSCPSPFEDFTALDKAESGDYAALTAALDQRLGEEVRSAFDYRESEIKRATEEVKALLPKAWQATRHKEATV